MLLWIQPFAQPSLMLHLVRSGSGNGWIKTHDFGETVTRFRLLEKRGCVNLLKQILLITDGCSNAGLSPVVAAAHAASAGVTVNVIGVVEKGEIGRSGAAEAEAIAQAGGGMCRIVQPRELAQTVQMMTRKTVAQTIQRVVEKELKKTFAVDAVERLSPVKRAHVVKVMDDLGETVSIRVCLLIDASASMKSKRSSVEEAVHDLALSLEARAGRSEISVLTFPHADQHVDIAVPWTMRSQEIREIFGRLEMRGVTPTGPAMMAALQYITENVIEPQRDEHPDAAHEAEPGMGLLRDYVV